MISKVAKEDLLKVERIATNVENNYLLLILWELSPDILQLLI
jgi:hypothetical protein